MLLPQQDIVDWHRRHPFVCFFLAIGASVVESYALTPFHRYIRVR
jgi:hypothetical protein